MVSRTLADGANNGVARQTWGVYKTARNKLLECAGEMGFSPTLPLSEEITLTFLTWLRSQNVKKSTMESYLSGLRQYHLAEGVKPPVFRTDIVKIVMEGWENMQDDKKLNTRYPCTPSILKLLKNQLRLDNMDNSTKIMIFAAATIGFFGGFRMSELLSRQENSYDPKYTLLKQDVAINSTTVNGKKVRMLSIKLKNSKTSKSSEIVDVYENDSAICPVKAYTKLSKTTKAMANDYPMFSNEKGKLLTVRKLNVHLHRLVNSKLTGCRGKVTAHSFRAGLTSIFGSLGYADEELKRFGRWSSRAFELYIKSNRTKRAGVAKLSREIANHLN